MVCRCDTIEPVTEFWLLLFSFLPPQSQPQGSIEEDFKVYSDHPRLFLNQRRLRLLKRERERTSLRWQQFEILMEGKAVMPEPGFSSALYYQVTGKKEHGRRAVQWALGPGADGDLRQLALVFDWCQELLSEVESRQLAGRLRKGLAAQGTASISAMRDGALAAVALAGHAPDNSEFHLSALVQNWWRKRTAPALRSGTAVIGREDLYAFCELLHAIQDNVKLDLREDAARYFKELPAFLLLAYYPATFPAAENEYRIPVYQGDGQPDLRLATLSRAAELCMVAYDTNNQELQYLQGWLINDRFVLRSPFGITYEFLWANPYQPGLSYYHFPLHVHDPLTGRLLIRSSWEESALWFYYDRGKVQMFENGTRKEMTGRSAKPLEIGSSIIHFGASSMKFQVASGEDPLVCYVINLKAGARYEVEIDDEELAEHAADRGGIVSLGFAKDISTGVRLRERR